MKSLVTNWARVADAVMVFAVWISFLSVTTLARGDEAVEAWVKRYDHNSSISRDEGTKVSLDSTGNVVVAGHTDIGTNGSTILILKYSSGGLPLWTNTFTSGMLSSNTISALAVDGNDDILIAATSDLFGATTIKYSATGVALWTNYYRASADVARDLAVTTNDDVIVTGQSIGDGGSYDQFVIQYSSAGVPQWTNRYSGPVGGDDAGMAVVVACDGNILVTGGSVGDSGGWDWLTIKYAGNGVPVWTNRYDSGSSATNQNNLAKAITTDTSGDVIVAGRTYLSGFEIIKYSSAGPGIWTNIVGGNHTAAYYVAVDQNQDVVFVGRPQNGLGSIGVHKYSSGGSFLWSKGFSTAHLGGYALDSQNNIVVTGEYQNSIFTVMLSSAGNMVTTNHYYAAGLEYGSSVATDSAGNFFVTGFSDESGSGESGRDLITIKYTVAPTPPAIGTPPLSVTNNAGEMASFEITATGSSPLRYQWWKNTAPVNDATNAVYILDLTTPDDAADYFVVVTNSYGSVTSSFATLTVLTYPPEIVAEPESLTNTVSSPAIFEVAVTGTQPVWYQWWKDGLPLLGSTDNGYNILDTQLINAGDYFVVVTNNYGSATSAVATLTVVVPEYPAILTQPQNATNIVGATATFQVTANGSLPLHFQWWKDGVPRVDATNDTLVLTNLQPVDAGEYFVVVTNQYGDVSSDVVTLVVLEVTSPTILEHPHSTNSLLGTTAQFTVVATGTAPLRYQWWHSDEVLTAATNSTLSLPNVQPSDGGSYFVVVTNEHGSVTSAVAMLTVMLPPPQFNGALVEDWVRRYGSATDSSDRPYKIVVDAGGNAIVAGTSETGMSNDDMLVIKYSGAGVSLWTNRQDGPGSGSDCAYSLALDSTGNILITGGSDVNGGTTIKYSGAGVALWTNYYQGPGDSSDDAYAVAVDANDDVFITGASVGVGGDPDIFTIKYSSAGSPLWTNRYDGPGHGEDYAKGLVINADGSVIVTGESVGSGVDFVTLKYSSAGAPIWTNRYNRPGGGSDRAVAIVNDGSGSAFVTGFSDGGGDSVFITAKYSSAGSLLWTQAYGGGHALALTLDGNGDVIVTGEAKDGGSDTDLITIKYASSGTPLWTNRFDGLGNGDDSGNTVVADQSGNVVVSGFSDRTGEGTAGYELIAIMYSSSGTPVWTNQYGVTGSGGNYGISVAADWNGDFFVTGQSENSGSTDCITLKYSAAGVPLWTNILRGIKNAQDQPSALIVDAAKNVLVTGTTMGGENADDYVTVKYSSAGVPLWTNRYDGPAHGYDDAKAIGVDSAGNVFVSGYSAGGANGIDCLTIAYSDMGVPLWTNRYTGAGYNHDFVSDLIVDGNGDVLITGSSGAAGTGDDYATIKYSNGGVPLWTNRYTGPGNVQDHPAGIAVDTSANVFVTGASRTSAGDYDFATLAYSSTGTPLWTNRFIGSASGMDFPWDLAVDTDGNVIVTGQSDGGATGDDFLTVKYSNTGAPLWTNRYDGSANGGDAASAVAVDASGAIVVTGASTGVGTDEDYVTIKYSATGTPLWTNRYNGPFDSQDHPTGVAFTANGEVVVTGYSAGSNYWTDYLTLVYSAAGELLSTNRYDGPAHGGDYPNTRLSLGVDPDGGVYVTGMSAAGSVSGNADFVTIKYVPGVVSNLPPVGGGFGATTSQDQVLAIAVSNLLAVVADPEGGAISLASVSTTSTNGALITLTNDVATYFPVAAFTGADRFTYVVTDNAGATNTIAAQIAVLPAGVFVQSFTLPTITSGDVSFGFTGNPGEAWTIERASELSGPWTNVGTILIQANGMANYQDFNLPPGSGYYRASRQ